LTEFKIKLVQITEIIEECEKIKSITFNVNSEGNTNFKKPLPGQFVMVWMPGVDEIPMSISNFDDKGNCTILVKNIGECTNALHNLKIADYIGVKGPLGNGFNIPIKSFKKIFLIAGGIGIAPIRYLATELNKKNASFILIEGARIKNELFFSKDIPTFNKERTEIYYCTDDGSYGMEGFASETFKHVLELYSKKQLANTIACTCGPEKMMHDVFQTCEEYGIELLASLERVMRCGCGLCGLCAIDPLGILVCKDGPVLNSKILRNLDDFGKFKRDFNGSKIPID